MTISDEHIKRQMIAWYQTIARLNGVRPYNSKYKYLCKQENHNIIETLDIAYCIDCQIEYRSTNIKNE